MPELSEFDDEKPFSQAYVLRITTKHMRKSVDISIRKTFERVREFAEDKTKSGEVFETLSRLHKLRKLIDDFQYEHAEYFKGK